MQDDVACVAMIIPGHANSCYFGKRDVINHKHATDARNLLKQSLETISHSLSKRCLPQHERFFSVFLPQHTLRAESPSILSPIPLPDFSRKIEGDSARRVTTARNILILRYLRVAFVIRFRRFQLNLSNILHFCSDAWGQLYETRFKAPNLMWIFTRCAVRKSW